ncbi:hypothetical protein F5148DRAFT_981027 [Russula earlei]|uniref:Uncharacterized protein n=1 Tax=Russula earlei TaxID=71964 RepID=A0ACC0U8P9_9AGAM|nr:hypothetical protein F5148DRAFT_981027 [Russula earlei]
MCGGPAWKREIVPDHKFDFVDTREFTDNGFAMRMRYLWLYTLVLKSFLVYVSDIFTAVTMLSTKSWALQIFQNCKELSGCVAIPFSVGQWLFVGCIIFSFLLLAYEARKTKKIVLSRDISYAFTNVMANNYYSLRSYDHFCFFDHIQQSTKKSDDFAFFVFFTFKSWKRLFFADGPRQVINALTLFAIYLAKKDNNTPWYNFKKYFAGNTLITTALTISTLFTVLVFAGSLLLLIIAAICYVPLLCYIKGNLKVGVRREYCCHKVDKRISEIIKRRRKERTAKAILLAKKEAMGDFSHLKNKKGEFIQQPLPQPTLPNISIDDDLADIASLHKRAGTPSTQQTGSGDRYYATDAKAPYDNPPMSGYNAPYSNHHYNPSVPTLPDENQYFEDDYKSTTHLALGVESYVQDDPKPSANYYESQSHVVDPYEVYTGNIAGQFSHQLGQHSHDQPNDGGMAYDDHQHGYQHGHSPPNSQYDAGQFHAV